MRRCALILLLACAHAPAAPPGFGRSKEKAVEVCLPPGEKAYFLALRCADGTAPRTRRLGNVGTRTQPVDPDEPRLLLQMDPERPLAKGEPDFHMVEAVEARCPGATYTLFFDMYHCPASPQPALRLGARLTPSATGRREPAAAGCPLRASAPGSGS